MFNGYFVHYFAPSGFEPVNKHVVFILDVSGSMRGDKIKQLQVSVRVRVRVRVRAGAHAFMCLILRVCERI